MGLRIGFGSYPVLPPLGVTMSGYDKRRGVAIGVHDPLWARAMVFDDGASAAALVVADVITVLPDQDDRVCRLVERWTGIPRAHVIAAGTHTHSGPTPQGRGRRAAPNQHFGALLPDWLASAVKLAWDERRPATMAAASATLDGWTINRRQPGGAVDPELTVVLIRRGRAAAGVLLNFACHGVVLGPDNLELSADWIGQVRATLAARQPELFSLVSVAPSGDVNPLPPSLQRRLRAHGSTLFTHDPFSGIYDRTGGTFAEAAAVGRALAEAALTALPRARRLSSAGGVVAATRRPDIGQRPARMVARCRIVRVGELALVAMAGEQFATTGLRVKEAVRSCGLVPLVVSHAPHLAYVPTPAAFAEERAQDYEVQWARRLGMAADAADREVAAIARAARALTS